MLIRTQKDFTQVSREYERDNAGKQLQCDFCEQSISMPPAIVVGRQTYHVKCAMQLVYGVLESLSGYGPEITPSIVHSMEEVFREAAQQRPQPKNKSPDHSGL